MAAVLSQGEHRTSYSLLGNCLHSSVHPDGFLQLTAVHKYEFGSVYLLHKSPTLKIIQTSNEIKNKWFNQGRSI